MGNPENHNSNNSYDWKNGGLKQEQIKQMLEAEKGKISEGPLDDLYENARTVIWNIEQKIKDTGDIARRLVTTEKTNKLEKLRHDMFNEGRLNINEKGIDEMARLIDEAENQTLKNFRALLAKNIGRRIPWKLNEEKTGFISIPHEVDDYGRVTFLSGSENIGDGTTFNDLHLFVESDINDNYVYENTGNPYIYINEEGDYQELESERYIDTRDYSYIIDYSKCSEEIKNEVRKKLGFLGDLEPVIAKRPLTWRANSNIFNERYDFGEMDGSDSVTDDILRFEIKCDGTSDNGVATVKLNGQDITQEEFGIGDFPVGEGLTIQEKGGWEIGKEDINNEWIHEYGILSKEDFEKDFAGDNFEQRNIGNCWMLSLIDSFINFGDYELLIRTNVKKNDEGGYDIYLPMGYPPEDHRKGRCFKIGSRLLNSIQMDKDGYYIKPVSREKGQGLGVECLVWALAQRVSGNEVPDLNILQAGIGKTAADLLLSTKSFGKISFMDKHVKDLLTGSSEFHGILKSYLESFNKKTDMMTVSVIWPESGERKDVQSRIRGIKAGGTPHDLSVDNVYLKDDGKLYIQLSNPHDADARKGDRKYIPPIPFDDFADICVEFSFASRNKSKVESHKNSMCSVEDGDVSDTVMKMLNVGAEREASGYNIDNFNTHDTISKEIPVRVDENDIKDRKITVSSTRVKAGLGDYNYPEGGHPLDPFKGNRAFLVNSFGSDVCLEELSNNYRITINGKSLLLDHGEIGNYEWVATLSRIGDFINYVAYKRKHGLNGDFVFKNDNGGATILWPDGSKVKWYELLGFNKTNHYSVMKKLVEFLNSI